MEKLVEGYIKKTGAAYSKEITTDEIIRNWNISLPSNFAANKRWDFAVRTPANVYAFETNFYTSGGSKLNETSRSYKLIAEQAANISLSGSLTVRAGTQQGILFTKHSAYSIHSTISLTLRPES